MEENNKRKRQREAVKWLQLWTDLALATAAPVEGRSLFVSPSLRNSDFKIKLNESFKNEIMCIFYEYRIMLKNNYE